MWLAKAWTTADKLSVIWKSDQFLPSSGRVDTAIWMHYMDANKTNREKARQQLHKNTTSNFEQVTVAAPHKAAVVRPPTTYLENYQN